MSTPTSPEGENVEEWVTAFWQVVHARDAAEAERDALRAAIQAVEKLCDEYRQNCDPTSRQAQVAEYFRAALVAAGADREDTEQPQPCPECASGSLLHALHGAGQVVPQQPTCDCYPDPRDHEPGCPVGQDT